jgi:HEAT repeat protein
LAAIYALAKNRTDESVAALKKLLSDADTGQESERIRQTVANAVRSAYNFRGHSQGRPLKEDDF